MARLIKQENFIEPDNLSKRQIWAFNALSRHFHKADRDFEAPSWEKDLECIDLLKDVGFSNKEIDPVLKHFNSVVDWIKDEKQRNKDFYLNEIEALEERDDFTPRPPKVKNAPV